MSELILMLGPMGLAFIAAFVLTPVVIRASIARGLVTAPAEGRHVHDTPVPRLGGVAVFAAMILGLAPLLTVPEFSGGLVAENPLFLGGILLGGSVLFGAGLVDDLKGLTPTQKLLAQTLAAVVIYYCGFRIHTLGVAELQWSLGWAALPVTVVWIVGVTNAFNLIDGLDGLASGIALVALMTTVVAAYLLGHVEVVVVGLVLVGALLGFLRYNFAPARIFLGDSGSLFIGFMLAVLSVHGSMKSATALLVIVPLFALALPILDTLLAIVRRWLRGASYSSPDARHLHHRLLALGLTQRKAVAVLYVAALGMAGIGLMMAFAPPGRVAAISAVGGILSLVILLAGVRQLGYHEFLAAGQVLAHGPQRARRIIQDHIHATDISRVIEVASSLNEIQAVLADNAAAFGFLRMELCTGWDEPVSPLKNGGAPPRAWKIYYPVSPANGMSPDCYLRVWCDTESSRPRGAERVARLLSPSLERWIASNGSELVVAETASAGERGEANESFPKRRRMAFASE